MGMSEYLCHQITHWQGLSFSVLYVTTLPGIPSGRHDTLLYFNSVLHLHALSLPLLGALKGSSLPGFFLPSLTLDLFYPRLLFLRRGQWLAKVPVLWSAGDRDGGEGDEPDFSEGIPATQCEGEGNVLRQRQLY